MVPEKKDLVPELVEGYQSLSTVLQSGTLRQAQGPEDSELVEGHQGFSTMLHPGTLHFDTLNTARQAQGPEEVGPEEGEGS